MIRSEADAAATSFWFIDISDMYYYYYVLVQEDNGAAFIRHTAESGPLQSRT